MLYHATCALGDRIYRDISSIWYQISLVLYPERDSDSDHPTDFLAFSVIVSLVLHANVYKLPVSRLLGTIAQDATYYFLFIFTSHLVLELALVLVGVRIAS